MRGDTWTNLSLSGSGLYAIDILFKRPNPDAIFNFYLNGYPSSPSNDRCGTSTCDGVAVCLMSPQGRAKRMIVLVTGQIAVENVGTTGTEPCHN